jgi:hypothetical protein
MVQASTQGLIDEDLQRTVNEALGNVAACRSRWRRGRQIPGDLQ